MRASLVRTTVRMLATLMLQIIHAATAASASGGLSVYGACVCRGLQTACALSRLDEIFVHTFGLFLRSRHRPHLPAMPGNARVISPCSCL